MNPILSAGRKIFFLRTSCLEGEAQPCSPEIPGHIPGDSLSVVRGAAVSLGSPHLRAENLVEPAPRLMRIRLGPLQSAFKYGFSQGESLVPETRRLKNLSSGSQEPGFQSPAASRFLCEPFPSRDLSSII